MVNWRNTRLPKLEEEDEITSVFEMVINETFTLGFQFCSFKMSAQQQTNQTIVFERNNYPTEWNALYQQAQFSETDLVVTHCQRSVLPFVWKESTFHSAPHLWELATSYGVHLGWTQPLHGPQGVFSMLTLGRGKGEITQRSCTKKPAMPSGFVTRCIQW